MQPPLGKAGFFGSPSGGTFMPATPPGIVLSHSSQFAGPATFPVPYPPAVTSTVGFQNQGVSLPPPPPFVMVRPFQVSHVTHTPGSALPMPSGYSTQNVTSSSASHGISEDEMWVKTWLDERKGRSGQSQPDHGLRLGQAAESVAECRALLDRLQDQLTDLQRLVTISSQEEFDLVAQKAGETWRSADTVLKQFADSDDVLNLARLVERRQKRRESQRRRRSSRKREQKDAEEKRIELHQKIDEWQAKKIAADISARQEAAVRSQAGGALGDVKRKVAEAENSRQLLKALATLRIERKTVLRREGVDITEEEDRIFSERLQALDKLLEKQLEVYSAEERTLKVMLAEEKEEEVQRQMAKVKRSAAERRREQDEDLGGNSIENTNEQDPSHIYYHQAEYGIAQFLAVRQQWDLYAVPSGTPGASCLPQGWLGPVLPSSKEWKQFLMKRNAQ